MSSKQHTAGNEVPIPNTDLSILDWGSHAVYVYDTTNNTEIQEKARNAADELGSLHGSIEDGDGNYAGLLAEFAFSEVFNAERSPTYEYDCLRGGFTIDVKTKRRTVMPKPYHEASIADYNTEQNADVYYFTSYNTDTGKIAFLGHLLTDEYYEKAVFREKGEKDPDNGFKFKADCYNLRYDKLNQVATGVLHE